MGDAGPEGVIVDKANLTFSDLGTRRGARFLARIALASASAFFAVGAQAEPNPTVRTDSNLIYVSQSTGDDANDGYSPATPKKTLAGGVSCLRDGYPDWLFLRRGDTWQDGFRSYDFTGRSQAEPIVISAYGPGTTNPKIEPSDPAMALPDEPYTVVYGVDYPTPPSGDGDPILMPGNGWAGPIGSLNAIGQPSQDGYDATAIARWDVVPFQAFGGTFEVGVLAFHMAGIDRVEFAVDGGPWVAVDEMSLNPRTNVYEYWVSLDASLHDSDGPVEVRAIAYPNVGVPRVLSGEITDDSILNGMHSMRLVSYPAGLPDVFEVFVDSSNGQDAGATGDRGSPFSTIKAAMNFAAAGNGDLSNVTISLLPGRYIGPDGTAQTGDSWVTIQAADGVDSEDVVLIGRARPKANYVRLSGLSIEAQTNTTIFEGWVDYDRFVWFDDVHLFGDSRADDTRYFTRRYHEFVTNSSYTDLPNGPGGALIVRNTTVDRIRSDAYSNSLLIVNSSVDDIDRLDSGDHPDVYQIYSPNERVTNRIVYGLRATNARSQGVFLGGIQNNFVDDLAFVNTLIEIPPDAGFKTQWMVPASHILFINSAFVEHSFFWRVEDLDNIFITASIFSAMKTYDVDADRVLSNITAFQNHFEFPDSYGSIVPGTNNTFGPDIFIDREGDNYKPTGLSVLVRPDLESSLPNDIFNMSRYPIAAVGPIQP